MNKKISILTTSMVVFAILVATGVVALANGTPAKDDSKKLVLAKNILPGEEKQVNY